MFNPVYDLGVELVLDINPILQLNPKIHHEIEVMIHLMIDFVFTPSWTWSCIS